MICFAFLLYIILKNCFSKEIDPAIGDILIMLGSLSFIEIFIEFTIYLNLI